MCLPDCTRLPEVHCKAGRLLQVPMDGDSSSRLLRSAIVARTARKPPNTMLLAWAIILFLILVNALYVAAEFASISVRRSQIAQLAEDGNGMARRLLPRLENSITLDNYIGACQIESHGRVLSWAHTVKPLSPSSTLVSLSAGPDWTLWLHSHQHRSACC